MPKQLSRCCKAEIELTWEDRPNHLKCKGCNRIIWTPYEIKYVSAYDLNNPREIPWWYVCDKINELIDAVNKLQDRVEKERPVVDNHTIDSLLLQVSQQQEAIDDIELQISKLWNAITSNGHYMQCGDRIWKIHSRPMDTATDTNVGTKRTPLDDLVDEIDELYPIEETRQITIRKKVLRKILERYFTN